ncbi:carboxymuconolactone decarboxylase [Pedobacter kyungheensis]|uniref:Carboxymuconolactone decarboxylase n=1 Tax=Pedobacter kyungheensis TaxID=1069985 RepID=A0A0C1DGB0_9SPHI|nr:carboxymuconolactone decarboxylase family protein [Pedobacter kyungheensis]KIA96611.1 carboxymuconolactone decarboxylase [Pedobacter kyungheensis]
MKRLMYKIPLLAMLIMNTIVYAKDSVKDTALSLKQQRLINIAVVAAKGDLAKLERTLNTGLGNGLTINQARETLVHLYAYCGFPRSLRALQTLMTVVEGRKNKGIVDQPGPEASKIESKETKYERGKKNLQQLTGIPEKGPKIGYAAFAPEIEVFLKEHLFADLFERDVLSFAERELVTISVLASIGGVEPMLKSHLNICLNLGFTADQLHEFLGLVKQNIGHKESNVARKVLQEVLENKK